MISATKTAVDPDLPMYIASTAVFVAEIIKMFTCVIVLVYKNRSLLRAFDIIREEIIEQPEEIGKMLVPSGLYALQNNLLYIALSNLEAATFQVTYQMKILSTAIFSVAMLNKRLTRQKWLSLCLLMVGVTLVQLQNVGGSKGSMVFDNTGDEEGDSEYLDAVGDSMSEAANMSEGLGDDEPRFAGCYFEKIIKGTETDMWVRNLQLGLSGALFSFLAMFYDRQKIYEGGMFQ
ncbi:hypothetical protein BGZ65_000086, partial [Modicella reniformis]